jgi:nicotinamidase-related amidase
MDQPSQPIRCALIVIDMLNHYEHKDGDRLMESVREMLPSLRGLIEQARQSDVLTVYVNDNYEDWSAGRERIVEQALSGADPSLIEPIVPPPDIPFVVKVRHSAFFQTWLEYLLRQEGIERLVLTGQVTEQCVLYSALDAYVRRFQITVPRDCVAHIDQDLARAALSMMEANMRATVVDTGTHAIEASPGFRRVSSG